MSKFGKIEISSCDSFTSKIRVESLTFEGDHVSFQGKTLECLSDKVSIGGAGSAVGLFGTAPCLQPSPSEGSASFVQNVGETINRHSTFDGWTLGEVVRALRRVGIIR